MDCYYWLRDLDRCSWTAGTQQRIRIWISKGKVDDGRDPGYKRNGGEINKYVLAILFDIKERSTTAEHTAPFAREEMSTESVPSRCRLSARTNKPGRQTWSGIEKHHEGMPAEILGPSLWNLVFDDLFTLEGRAVREIAYADDLLILVSGNSHTQIETAGQTAIGIMEK